MRSRRIAQGISISLLEAMRRNMVITHDFSLFITLNGTVHPAIFLGKLEALVASLKVSRCPDAFEVIFNGQQSSARNDVAHFLPSLVTLV